MLNSKSNKKRILQTNFHSNQWNVIFIIKRRERKNKRKTLAEKTMEEIVDIITLTMFTVYNFEFWMGSIAIIRLSKNERLRKHFKSRNVPIIVGNTWFAFCFLQTFKIGIIMIFFSCWFRWCCWGFRWNFCWNIIEFIFWVVWLKESSKTHRKQIVFHSPKVEVVWNAWRKFDLHRWFFFFCW